MSIAIAGSRIHVVAPTKRSRVARRFVAGLDPAVVMMGLYGDFARSVSVGDEVAPLVDMAASTAARLPEQSRNSVASDLALILSARHDIANPLVSVVTNQDGSVTVTTSAQATSRFMPMLKSSYGFERSVTVPTF